MTTYKTMTGKPQALTSVTGLARTFALPHECPAVRLPSFPALERTAVMAFNGQAPLTVNTAALNGTGTRLLLTRQPAMPVWVDTTWSKIVCTYTYAIPNVIPASESLPVYKMTYALGGSITAFNQTVTNADSPPLGMGPVGLDSGCGAQEWMYVPTNSRLTVVVDNGAVATGGTLTVAFDVWAGPGETVTATVALASSNNVWFIDATAPNGLAGNWIRPSSIMASSIVNTVTASYFVVFVSGMANPGSYTAATKTFTAIGSTSVDLMPLLSPPAFSVSIVPYASTRMTAVGLLGTNVTKVLNKEGTVTAARLNPRMTNPFQFQLVDLQTLHPAEKYYAGLEKGFYTYCPPSTDLAEFVDCSLRLGFGPVPVYRLDNTAFVNALSLNDPDGGTSIALNVDWHIEFRNNTVLWPVGVSTTTLETLHQAQISLLQTGFFFDNVDHKWLLGKVLKATKYLSPMAGPFAGPLYMAAKMGSRLLKGKSTLPAPTSAKGSGMMPPDKPQKPRVRVKPPGKQVKVKK